MCNSKWSDATKEIGNLLGFPSCCIKEFITLDHVGGPKRKLTGTGYVPCESCNDLFSEEELISRIMENRSEGLPPFPKTPSEEIATIWRKYGYV